MKKKTKTKNMSESEMCSHIRKIESRNRKVEMEKKWETSWTRRLAITFLTYWAVLLYLYIVGNSSPWVNAIVPAAAFLLSTLALGWLRELWRKKLI